MPSQTLVAVPPGLRQRGEAVAGGFNSGGVGGGGSPPHDVRRSDDSRSHDSRKGAVTPVNIPKTSGTVGGG